MLQLQEYPLFRGIKSDKARKPSYGHLKLTVDEDRDFLQEITLLNAIADKVLTATKQPFQSFINSLLDRTKFN